MRAHRGFSRQTKRCGCARRLMIAKSGSGVNANAWRAERGYELLPDLRASAFSDYLKPLVLLSLHTGVRRGELFALTWQSVELQSGRITVHGATAKSGRTRHIPLNTEALD